MSASANQSEGRSLLVGEMEKGRRSAAWVIAAAAIAVMGVFVKETQAQGLSLDFYKKTCPQAEGIVRKVAEKHIPLGKTVAAPLLRMHFHDCFVRGCDGSVLINSTRNNSAEKEAVPNRTLRGFSLIDEAKEEIEKECPGVVSCADILALMARDAVLVAFGGPSWPVPTGRRDGVISSQSEATANIPQPTFNFSQLNSSFSSKGLDIKDLVVLSGGHTVGIGHCQFFKNRLYNFTGKGDEDPSMDSEYVANLKKFKCTTPQDNTTIVEMDPGSFLTFDVSYYQLLAKRRGLFQSDAALLTDSSAKSYVLQMRSNPSLFFSEFSKSMVKMGQIGVLTGSNGEIRKHCAVVNS